MADMRNGVNAYITELRKYTGNKKVGVYIAHNRYKDFNLDLPKADFVWIPHYGENNGQVSSTPEFYCDLHQYTSTGHIDGYAGNLDLDRLMNGRTVEFFTGVKTEPKPIISQPVPQPMQIPEYYIVQSGDTLSGIASKHGTTYQVIARLNNITNPDKIYPGQKIILVKGISASQPIQQTQYIVKAGDTLSEIAAKFNTTVANLAAINHIANPNLIKVGQKLSLRGSVAADKPTVIYYVVKSGDTLSEIAVRNNTSVKNLCGLNPQIKNPNLIRVGQRIRVK
jgi:LysM repeat protein